MFLHLDCRYFLGDRPCKFQRLCEGCPHYEPMGPRVLIVKLGALGDVVRTASLLPGLRKLTTDPPYVTWLAAPGAVDLVRRMNGVDRVLPFDAQSINRLNCERFDYVISLDKEPGPCSVATSVQAENKLGVGLSRYGTPQPFNEKADYYFQLGLDNDEKFFRNRKTYPHLIYDAVGIPYEGESYSIELTDADHAAAEKKFSSFAARGVDRWIGLNPGAGSVYAYKAWREEGYLALVRALVSARPGLGFVLLGGPEESERLARMQRALADAPVFHAGTDNSLGEFAAIIDRCQVVVCGDTLAMHLAIARRRRVVAIFGPTCEQEIDVFGRGVKIKSPIECSPCYLRACDKDPTCQDQVTDQQVIDAVLAQLA